MDIELEASDLWDLCKHGIGLGILMFLLVIGWAFIFGILVVMGAVIGLLIGLGVLVLALGYINGYLAEAVWGMSTDEELIPRFVHGVLLIVVLITVNIPAIALTYLFPHWLMSVILFIIYVPVHGYVGVRVAEVFQVDKYGEEGSASWGD
ncbi:MAG: hypothetical protein AB9819_07260 [Methanomassiliicoccales archaeon]